MSEILSQKTIEWVISWTKDENEIGWLRKVCDSHEALRQAEYRGWSASERHSLMWQTAVRQGEMLTTENRCLRERVEKLEEALSQIERGCSFPEDDVQQAIVQVARAALEADDE